MNQFKTVINPLGLILCLGLLLLPSCLWAASDLEVYNRRIIPKEYQRIVSLAPNITEILFALGLEDRIIGVTKHCNYPDEALKKTCVGSYIDLNIEKILFLKPDLVIATADGNEKGSVERLAALKIPVLVTNPKNLDEVFEVVKTIGRITRQENRAEIMVRSLKKRADWVVQACLPLSHPRVFLQINEHPLITVGKDTFHNSLIKQAGGINISGEESIKYPKLSMEQVLRANPEVILITTMERGVMAERKKDRWRQWDQLSAVKLDRIHILDSDLLDRPSPRLVDGLEALARAIHPEFGTKTKESK
jgi:iron complex transport system substrate-binding protein